MIRKILCWLGIHSIEFYHDKNDLKIWKSGQKCKDCGKVLQEPMYYPPCPPLPKPHLLEYAYGSKTMRVLIECSPDGSAHNCWDLFAIISVPYWARGMGITRVRVEIDQDNQQSEIPCTYRFAPAGITETINQITPKEIETLGVATTACEPGQKE